MKGFNIIRWDVPENVRHLHPEGIRVLRFLRRDVVFIWYRNVILLYDNVDFKKIEGDHSCSKSTHVLSVEGTILNVLQFGEVIGIFNGHGLFTLVKSQNRPTVEKETGSTQWTESLDLKMHMKMNGQVLALATLRSGFVLIKKKSRKLYVDIYTSDSKMTSAKKAFSVKLPQLICNDVTCIMKSVESNEMDPVLANLLIDNAAIRNSEILFVGIGSGQAYCIPIVAGGISVPTPKILYHTTQPITGIVCLRGTENVYSQVGLVLKSGHVMYIMCHQQKLRYYMVYLPGTVEDCCSVKDGIITANGVDLWYSKLHWNNEDLPIVENTMLGVKGVYAVCPVPHSEAILAVNIYTMLYYVYPHTMLSNNQPKSIVVPPKVKANLDNQMEHLAKYKLKVAMQEKAMETVSIKMRESLLQNTFEIQVQVHDTTEHQYTFEINLKNTLDQDYSPEIWLLCICLKAENLKIVETSKLEQRIRKGICVKRFIRTGDFKPLPYVEIICSLIAQLSKETEETESTMWADIPIASVTLDVSYLFSPSVINNGSTLSHDLSQIAQNYFQDDEKSSEMQESKDIKDYVYVFRMLAEKKTPHEIWTVCINNSRHRFIEVANEEEFSFYVKQSLVTLTLIEEHSLIQIKTSDLKLLHQIKTALMCLLKEQNSKTLVNISRDVLSRAQKTKEDLQLQQCELKTLKQNWRETVAKNFFL